METQQINIVQEKKICFAKDAFALVKRRNNDSDKLEFGDVVGETENCFTVKPHLRKDNNFWLKVDCEIVEYYK